MYIEEEITVAYLLISRMRKKREKREKRKPQNKSVGRIFLKREEKGALVLFHYFSWCFIFLDITFVGFSQDFCKKNVCFSKNQKNYLSLALMILSKNDSVVSAKYGNIKEDQKKSSVSL